jgi:hypothetical protein
MKFSVLHHGVIDALETFLCYVKVWFEDLYFFFVFEGTSVPNFFHTMRRQFTESEWTQIRKPTQEWEQLKVFYRLWVIKPCTVLHAVPETFYLGLSWFLAGLHKVHPAYTRVIQKIRGQCRSPLNYMYLSEIQNQYIIFCKNIYSINVWIFIATGQMDLILINFKTNMFCTHGAIIMSET